MALAASFIFLRTTAIDRELQTLEDFSRSVQLLEKDINGASIGKLGEFTGNLDTRVANLDSCYKKVQSLQIIYAMNDQIDQKLIKSFPYVYELLGEQLSALRRDYIKLNEYAQDTARETASTVDPGSIRLIP